MWTKRSMSEPATNSRRKIAVLAAFLAILAGSISRVARRFLLRQQRDQLFGFLTLLGFGGGLGFFFFALLLFFGGEAGSLGLGENAGLFGGALLLAFVACGGDGGAFLGALIGGRLGGFGARLDLGKHLGAGLGGRFHSIGEFFVVLAGHDL